MPDKKQKGKILAALAALALGACDGKALQDCQKKYPNLRVKVIEKQCHYADEFGWIKDGKIIIKQRGRTI